MKKILIVEDDPLLNKTLAYNLSADGYRVFSAFTIKEAQEKIIKNTFDLIVLDVNLPDGNGFDLCEKIKKEQEVSVLFLTANDMEKEMIRGFELGADDYVTKPFPLNVLGKKIAALLNRITKQRENMIYNDPYLKIDFLSFSAEFLGKSITFTPMEYRTLTIFVQNPKTLLTRQVLLEKLWDVDENFVDEHTLTTMISRIRSKIETKEVKYIKTVYGMGYMWIGEKE